MSLNEKLGKQSFLNGHSLTEEDFEKFASIKIAPNDSEPNTLRWYNHMRAIFARKSYYLSLYKTGAAPPAAKGGDSDDDMDDLFDGEPVEVKPKKAAPVKKAKAGPISKSLVVFDVKPWDTEQNLDDLAKKVLAIEMDGLFWKTEYKLVDVAFGIKKLQIGCTVEDEKVSTDLLQETMEAMEDDVQSVDVASFSKI
mmetsp:Transcript_19618/g.22303  ORF Transcript_19618/g.22303 Transcript_19618/m.22303 type:complete len:196 (-) Transcript_19618:64-651(-)